MELSWEVLGGQDAPKTAQDRAKTLQDGAKTAQDGAKTGQGGAKTPQNNAKTFQDGAETGPRASRHTNIEKTKVQDVSRTLQKDSPSGRASAQASEASEARGAQACCNKHTD